MARDEDTDANPRADRSAGAEVLVVLGAALAPNGDLGPALAERVQAGVDAWKAGAAPWLMMTGELEALKMRARAVALGVPEARVMVEPTARTTHENATRCAALMALQNLKQALIVTQPYHRRRAVAAFRRAGVDAQALAFVSRRPTSAKMWAREWVGLAFYRLRGWV